MNDSIAVYITRQNNFNEKGTATFFKPLSFNAFPYLILFKDFFWKKGDFEREKIGFDRLAGKIGIKMKGKRVL